MTLLRYRLYLKEQGTTIAGVTEFKVEDCKQVMDLLIVGNKRRSTESTNANQTSSRSHVWELNSLIKPFLGCVLDYVVSERSNC